MRLAVTAAVVCIGTIALSAQGCTVLGNDEWRNAWAGDGLLLLVSRPFAQVFFRVSRRLAPKKLRVKIERLRASWGEMHDYFWGYKRQLLKIGGTSIFIWFLHLLQIWLFILALQAWAPFLSNLALAPLAILAGLLLLTFAGVGTRDAALIALYQPFLVSQQVRLWVYSVPRATFYQPLLTCLSWGNF
ncbi:MAG: hypothetical protein BRC42_04430 [Cyanobacteria bacterium QS_1_48_34]|nr:MAG: hypothetical protein BRC42_04430 [Cyanobacteria bacterium QS_1_48_34]